MALRERRDKARSMMIRGRRRKKRTVKWLGGGGKKAERGKEGEKKVLGVGGGEDVQI